jgi:hypothetical protein
MQSVIIHYKLSYNKFVIIIKIKSMQLLFLIDDEYVHKFYTICLFKSGIIETFRRS